MSKKNKQKIRGIIWLCIIAIAAIAIIIRVTADDTDYGLYSRIMSSNYDISDHYAMNISYEDYLRQNGEASTFDAQEIIVDGNEYSDTTLSFITKMEDGNILTGNEGDITYSFNIEKSGYYYVEIGYYPSADSDKNIVRNLYINGNIPFTEASGLMFERMWVDENKSFVMVSDTNQASPSQMQSPAWLSKKLECADKTVEGPLMFYLKAGENKMTLESVSSGMGIDYIKLVPASGLQSYAEYITSYEALGVSKIDSSSIENGALMIQAEDTLYKSSAMLIPQNDRTSPCTIPYHSSNIVLNTIGGANWSDAGASITWEVIAPKSGLYKIALRFQQSQNRDFYSVRELKINGEVPFKEASALTFKYDTNFQIDYLGDESNEYYFYLKEGQNNISMTVSLGDLSYAITQTKICIKNLNSLYRRFTAVMSSSPDKYRDYDIVNSIPDMVEILEAEYYRLSLIMESLGESLDSSAKTRQLAKMVYQLQKLINKPDSISLDLATFNDNITAISEWVLSLDEQPLIIDYLLVTGDGYKLPRADGNFFMNFNHGFKAFIGSFTNDYSVHVDDNNKKDKTVVVWIATATRDQFDIAQKMIINDFAQKDYNVEIKMVGADTVMPATLTGNGPDVAIQLNYTMPTNFAYRNAGYDLSTFPDFDEVRKQFSDGAMEYFEYEGGYYGLPDEMSFPVMFYRKDILSEMGLEVPKTWDELKAMLPYLQAENMNAYFTTGYTVLGGASTTSTKPINAVFGSLLYQNGEELFASDNKSTNLDNLPSLLTFKEWTDYYVKESLPVTISVVTRFRTGDVPIFIDDYTTINSILAAAPEISGQWSIAPIPGTRLADGTIDKSVCANVGAAMIIKGSVEKNGTAEEAWEFLKWWTSKETQLSYSREQKALLGDAGNFPVANLDAIREMADELGFGETVDQTLLWSRGVPQVPGGYIAGRYIENSFMTVYNKYTDAVYTLYSNVRYINQEITNKREEFGLID